MLTSQSLFIEPPRRDRITAISGVVQRRPIVLVLGMHRSGTSLCSHLLSALGVDMADQIPGPRATVPTRDNPRGHWERWEIVEFHDRILGLFNRDYLGRFHDFALPVAWWADPRVAQIRREIVAFLEAARDGSSSPVSGNDGRNALALALRAHERIQEHAAHPGVSELSKTMKR